MMLRRTIAVFVLGVSAFMYHSCEPAFNPINSNKGYYSIFGYLNASADTNYVRIEQLRDSMATDTPAELNAKVTLTNTTTGETVTLKDSLFSYYESGKAHNYYTTMNIEPEQQYRLEVAGPEGSSSATVTIPHQFPEPKVLVNNEYRTTIGIPDMDRLIAVRADYHTCTACDCEAPMGKPPPPCTDDLGKSLIRYSHLADTLHRGGQLVAEIDRTEDNNKLTTNFADRSSYVVMFYDVVIAAGSPQWPEFHKLNTQAVALPDVASNVKQGVGLLGGIITDTVNVERHSCGACISCHPDQVTCEPSRVHP